MGKSFSLSVGQPVGGFQPPSGLFEVVILCAGTVVIPCLDTKIQSFMRGQPMAGRKGESFTPELVPLRRSHTERKD